MATGIKRVLPNRLVFTYQGDGDLASIGMAEIMHAAGRGENITVIFLNNAIYGMTGGQMAPTTLPGQKTTSSPTGGMWSSGFPLHMSEVLSKLDGPSYIVRRSLHDPKNIRQAKKAIRTAFEAQSARPGLLDGRAALHLPHQLGRHAGGGAALVGRAHGTRLSAGRLQSLSRIGRVEILRLLQPEGFAMYPSPRSFGL